MAALAVSDSVDWTQRDAREERYKQIIAKYDAAERKRFPEMLSRLVLALEDGPTDVLGGVFGELDLGNAARGQFFTPYEVCRLMARITIGDGAYLRDRVEEVGFVSVSEPACGAGAMVIAFAEAVRESGVNYQQHLHVPAPGGTAHWRDVLDPADPEGSYRRLRKIHHPDHGGNADEFHAVQHAWNAYQQEQQL